MKQPKTNVLILTGGIALMFIPLNLLAQDLADGWYLGLDAGLALRQDATIEERAIK